ncbi:MAG: ABC transporter permease [Armatimonadota bacterium]|nr:ABC transporter permease [Armatimonadota bacterium]
MPSWTQRSAMTCAGERRLVQAVVARRVSPPMSPLWAAGRRFARHRLAVVGFGILLAVVGMATVGPTLVPRDLAYRPEPGRMFMPPGAAHPLGTDEVGRDVLARLVVGARVSLTVGVLAMVVAITVGTTFGAAAGFYRGWVDAVLMRASEVLLSLPRLFLLIVLAAFFGPSVPTLVLVIGGLSWMESFRVIRASVLALREREFVQAARALGATDAFLIRRHILPNTMAAVVVGATLGVGNALLTEATVSYLGLGVQPPDPSWGNMLYAAQKYLLQAPHVAIPPGLLIFVTVLGTNFVGDGLRDALDPRVTRTGA